MPIEFIANKLEIELKDLWLFPAGACFTVTKKQIYQYSIKWYIDMLYLAVDLPLAPWAIERLWSVIFNLKNASLKNKLELNFKRLKNLIKQCYDIK